KLEKALGDSAQEIDDLRKKLKNVSRAARTDALTDLANRKYFAKRLREAAKEATETKNPLALLMLDVDNFKEVNDNWGHLVGDHVLRLISKTLVESIKGRDLAARYGGDEFAVVLPNTRLKDASTLAEQIRKTISTKKLSLKNTGESIRGITASIGVAAYRHGETLDELIHRADQALYSAKNDGRNRVATEAPLQALAAANS
ncbi:MAG: GGDEF domain-containing protein, partial [Alphaproteobacteria bacterium]